MRKIRFTATTSSTVYGSFSNGDQRTFEDDVARHFVEDAGAAVYVDQESTDAPPPATQTLSDAPPADAPPPATQTLSDAPPADAPPPAVQTSARRRAR